MDHPVTPELAVVVGCIAYGFEVMPIVSAEIGPDDIAHPPYRAIYRALIRLYDTRVEFDVVAILQEVGQEAAERHGITEEFIGKLCAAALTSPEAVIAHAKTVRDAARKQRLRMAGLKIAAEAAREDADFHSSFAAAQAALDDAAASSDDGPVLVADGIVEVLERFKGGHVADRGVATGFEEIDVQYGALRRGGLTVIAGRPGSGKTTLACNAAVHAARSGVTVLIFSAEMSRSELIENLLCSEAQIESGVLRAPGPLSEEVVNRLVRAATEFARLPLYIDDRSAPSPARIRATALSLRARTKGLGLIVVDYLQLLDASAGRSRSTTKNDEIGWLTAQFKSIAKDLDVPVLLIAQLNRQAERRDDRRPMLSDLRDSGCIEQDADIVMLIHRAELGERDPVKLAEVKGEAEVIVAKNRAGPTGTVLLRFDGRFYRFTEAAPSRF